MTDGPHGERGERRGLALGSAAVAASAYGGAVGLARMTGPEAKRLTDQLPFRSRLLGAAALTAAVAVPHTLTAWYAWRGDQRSDPAAVASGGMLMGWIGVQVLVIEDRSFLQPLYAGIGALMVVAGRRWVAHELRRVDPRPGDGRPDIEGGIEILRPQAVVFDTVADERNEPRYNPRLRAVQKTTTGPLDAGTRFRAEAVSSRRNVPMTIEITEYVRPRRLSSTTRMRAMDVHGSVTFEPTARGTRMRWRWDVEPHGPLRLARPAVVWLGRAQERRIWRGLKRLLEEEGAGRH